MSFEYEALDSSRQEIRLLRIYQATKGPIEGELVHQYLGQGSCVRYEAVSYVWGAANLTRSIILNGTEFPVTESAFEVLELLRRDGHEYIWIDSVYINQDNNTEKGHQVQQIRDIYASAHRVTFYLGQASRETDLFMHSLSILQEGLDVEAGSASPSLCQDTLYGLDPWERLHAACDDNMRERLHATFDDSIRERLHTAFDDNIRELRLKQRSGLRELLQRPWFRRVWIVQEVHNAQNGVVRCGTKIVTCETFALAVRHFQIEVDSHCQNILDAMPTSRRPQTEGMGKDNDHTLYNVLLKYRYAEASRMKDKIYGLLGLCRFTGSRELTIDYNKSSADIVRETTAHICFCNIFSLSEEYYQCSIDDYLTTLNTLDQRTFNLLVRSTVFGTVESIMSMLRSRRRYFDINVSTLEDAARNEVFGKQRLQLLLADSAHPGFTQEVFMAAIQNKQQGVALVKFLLSTPGFSPHLNTQVISNIILNKSQGARIAEYLLRHVPLLLDLSQKMTLSDFLHHREEWFNVCTFFHRRNAELEITHAILQRPIGKPTRSSQDWELTITEEAHDNAEKLIREAIRVTSRASDGVKGFLRERSARGQVPCPPAILAVLMQDPLQTHVYLDAVQEAIGIKEMAEILG